MRIREQNTNREIKLVFITGGLGLGGSERQLYLTIKHLDRDIFNIAVLNLNPHPDYFSDKLAALSIPVFAIPIKHKTISRRARFMYHVLREMRPHIVHSWNFYANSYAGIIGRLAGVPVQIGSQRNAFDSEYIHKLPKLHQLLSLYSVSRIVVNSQLAKSEMIDAGYPSSRVSYIPNLIEIEDIGEPSAMTYPFPAGLSQNSRLIGIVGNLRQQKNHLLFIDAMAEVKANFPDVGGLIIGQSVQDEPEILEQVKDRIYHHGLDNTVVFAGYQEKVFQFLKHLTIFCLTSDYEGMPNVIMEAMLAKVPVVATRVGGVPELIEEGITGFLVTPGDVSGLAQSINALLSDPLLARRMGQAGLNKLLHDFDPIKTSQQFTSFYLNALQG